MMNYRTPASLFCLFTALLAIALGVLSTSHAFSFLFPNRVGVIMSFFKGFPLKVLLFKQDLSSGSPLSNASDGWDLFHHLGGNGPWIEKSNARFGTYDEDGDPPTGCVVDQVHMLSRHAERYPTTTAGGRHLSLLSRLQKLPLNGSLYFLNSGNWSYFIPSPSFHDRTFGDLTTTSPYAGTLAAFTLGTTFRTRYSHLLPTSKHEPLSFWSASSGRDVETALYFADGFFGRDWSSLNASNPARLRIVPEEADRGGNTLTPGDTCLKYISDTVNGHDQGYAKLAEWQSVFSGPISARLSAENPALDPPLSAVEVYSTMELCGFETLVRGSSPWCEVFTPAEWEQFEYGRDVLHFYRAGPGNRFSRVMGSLWLNATARLLAQESGREQERYHEVEHGAAVLGSGGIYVSFVHDGDIVPVIAALGILDEEDEDEEGSLAREGGGGGGGEKQQLQQQLYLPTDHVKRHRNWRTSDVVPMSGRLIIERLNCRTPHGWRYRDVRLFVNDGWVGWPTPEAPELPTEHHGEQNTKKRTKRRLFVPQLDVNRFVDMVRHRSNHDGGFKQLCGLDDHDDGRDPVDDHITFLHQ